LASNGAMDSAPRGEPRDRRFHHHHHGHADQHHGCQVMGEPGIYGRILIGRVLVGTRHRKLDPDKVKALADSMKAIGQQQPISVYYGEAGQVHLIAGSHRLEAAKLLGWEKVACILVTLSEIDRDLWEIDENLCRAELSAPETREHVHRRKELWERRQAEKNNGAPCATNRGRGRPKGFAAETAAAVGKSKSQINKLIAEPKAKGKKPSRRHRRTEAEIRRDGFIRFVDNLDILITSDASDCAPDLLTKEQRADAIETGETAIAVLRKIIDRLRLMDRAG
jgi:hypothetical protein